MLNGENSALKNAHILKNFIKSSCAKSALNKK